MACNLKCRQCHASGGKRQPDELTTEEGKRLLQEMAQIPEFRMLAFTGGEPLLRPDVFELIEYASSLGFQVSVATNGTLVTSEVARRLKRAGVINMAIGINAANAQAHESITQVPGSFEQSMRGIYASREAGMGLQINATVMQTNYSEIPRLLDLASDLDAEVVLLYQLIPTGRGEEEEELSMKEYANLIQMVSDKQKNCKAIIEPICSPIYWAYLLRRNGAGRLGNRFASSLFKGCVAGSGLCYIKPNGEVWACPFLPVSAGNVHYTPLTEIWSDSPLFQSLRDRANLKGKCGACSFNKLCGGCRGRAYAHCGDYLAEDPLCWLSATDRT